MARFSSREFQDRLTRRARRVGVEISSELGARLEVYYRLLGTWNQRINLSGMDLDEPAPEPLDRLLVEPLVAAKHVPPGTGRLIDIGSGGGSPAIPLCLALPGARVLLVESKTRKSVFLREAIRALEMTGSDVATSRFEELLSKPDLHEAHDLLTLRAVKVEGSTLRGLQALVRPGGQLFLFRSAAGADPKSPLPTLFRTATFPLIQTLGSRLVIIEKPTR